MLNSPIAPLTPHGFIVTGIVGDDLNAACHETADQICFGQKPASHDKRSVNKPRERPNSDNSDDLLGPSVKRFRRDKTVATSNQVMS